MKTIAIIPARGGSKRLPGKNLLPLGGMPLIAHSILYARANSDIIDQIYVTTNDAQIKQVALDYGAQVIDRPSELSGDLEPTATALRHALLQIDDASIENVIVLQPTNPIRPKGLIRNAFDYYIEHHFDSLFTVSRSHQKLGKIVDGHFAPFNYEFGQRSQDMQPLFYENGLLYISSRSLLLENRIISQTAHPYEVTDLDAIDIDTESDLAYAEYLLTKK